MTAYRESLPQLQDKIFLLDGGLETMLVYHYGLELPYFAAFELLNSTQGMNILREYFQRYVDLALSSDRGLILEAPTWRANPDWAQKMGYGSAALADINRRAIALMEEFRQTHQRPGCPFVVAASVGPRGDGYIASQLMSADQAQQYHAEQIGAVADTSADFISALTLNYVDEAVGITRAAQEAGIPVVISFTTETDGSLPDGTSLKAAIEAVDAATGEGPAYYMINCAHPEHFSQALAQNEPWVRRIRGLRANASRKSHAELEASTELDSGDPQELGQWYQRLRTRFSHLNVLGGCCGTDIRHIEAINASCAH